MPETVWRFLCFYAGLLLPGLWRWRSGLCVLKTLRRFLMVKMAYEWKKKLIFAAENRVCHKQNAAIGWIAEV